MKKGFTLLELLAVIIILAVIALIATPIVLNVIESSKKQANKNSVYGLIDGARLYYAESMLDENKANKLTGNTDLLNDIKVSGKKPEKGNIYINKKGEIALAVVYDKICYTKKFNEIDLSESNDIDNCKLGNAPEVSYKCKRATTLHKETCTYNGSVTGNSGIYCENHFNTGDTITYGNLGQKGTLATGDAFDCDVNGDGTYDSTTERFYYVNDLYNTTTQTFDNNYAVLIYYNNTINGLPDSTNSLVAYSTNATASAGPTEAMKNLPTNKQWSNVSLSNNNRQLLTNTNSNTLSETNLSLINYEGYSSRFLTYQEIKDICKLDFSSGDPMDIKCIYLLENLGYDDGMGTWTAGGTKSAVYWLETIPDLSYAMMLESQGTHLSALYFSIPNASSRPVIEVLKTDIEI